jgi:16S rRNA (uracil1498-N3)-methyltransferase
MHYFFHPDIQKGTNTLSEEESHHCVKVLRHREGENIHLLDGKGGRYLARLTHLHARGCQFELLETLHQALPSYQVHLAIAPTKNSERMEWMVEKCTELGIQSITLLQTAHTEKKGFKTDRLLKKAIGALKQSYSGILPKMEGPMSLEDFFALSLPEHRFIAYVDETNTNSLWALAPVNAPVVVMVGPEGDFSPDEVVLAQAHHFKKVHLGPTRLRTETAGLIACHTLHLKNSQ